ncbi:metallophosphoesterase [Streptomyces kroppenstedtii]|uniref:metallophosphoesterase n=1 Tax=Streptomyces kroppenstedtii TaxID=3051181 RepID=UPI0028D0FB57|nr:metallophosphoesterase [Streptomyces sp. DSM 40484]
MVIVFVVIGVLVLAVFGGLHWYLWRRLVRDTTARPGVSRRVGTAVLVGGPLLMFAAITSERTGAPFWLQQVLAWPGFLWMALSLYLLLALLVGEAVRPLLRRFLNRRTARRTAPEAEPLTEPVTEPAEVREAAHVPAGASAAGEAQAGEAQSGEAERPSDASASAPAPAPTSASAPASAGPSRRLLISRVVGGVAASAAVGTVGYGTYGVLSGPKVKRVTVPLAKLPRAAHGYRIAVVSDIHLGPVLGRGFAQKVVDTINSTQPDLIAVVGDLVDGSVKDLGPAAAPLAQLRARHGSFFVTGNHEYFSGAEEWVARVRELGLNPLENARTELAHFDLAGVNDVAGEDEGQGPDFAKALGDRDRARTCVLLAHQPVQIHDAVDHGVDLQLSGHTHGGQLWPGNFIADLANPTLAGLERYGDTQLYVSRGAGAWGPPTRVGAPSDITVVELASKQA